MFLRDISLAAHSSYKIGGAARYFYQADKLDGLVKAIETAKKEKLAVFTLGGGTNLLFNDAGYNGLVLKPSMNFIEQKGNLVTVGAGAAVSSLLEYAINKSLSGLEWAGGLPGLVGGAIRGNAGAFGGETKDSIVEVVSLDFSGKAPKVVRRNNKQCRFGYRDSVFKSGPNAGKEIILEATFQLAQGDKKEICQSIEDKIKWRESRQPLDYPNIGSIFKNVPLREVRNEKLEVEADILSHVKTDPFPVIPAATLIDKCGLKGISFGGAMISSKHPNFIVNCGAATADDVKTLVKLVKNTVYKKYDIKLEKEVIFV